MTSLISLIRQQWLNGLCLIISLVLIYNTSLYWFSEKKQTFENTKTKTNSSHVILKPEKSLSSYPVFGQHLNDNNHIPTTLLNLKLIGILTASDPKDSQALIKVGDNEEMLFQIDDEISDRTILSRVLKDAVLLKRNGKIERLSLPKMPLNTQDQEKDLEE